MDRQDAHAPAKAYAMKAMEDKVALDFVVGNFYIFETVVHALIDPGSTHSYICTAILSLGSLSKSKSEYDILVTNPLGHSVIVNRVYRDALSEYECSNPQARSDPNGESEPKPGDARFISFIFRVIKFSFSKMSRPEFPA